MQVNHKVVIFGTGKGGRHLFNQFNEIDNFEIVAFLDNYQQGTFNGIPVYKPQTFFDDYTYDNYEYYITGGAQKTVKLMLDTLTKMGEGTDIYLLYDIAGKNEIDVLNDGKINPRWIHKVRFEKKRPTIHYFEVPVTDLCNLNCRGCIFGCNSAQMNNTHISTEQIIKDIRRMAELFCDVPWIRILGGEPLMHPDIYMILKETRDVFTESEIDLCTNGLLIPKMDEQFLKGLKNLNISVHISGYPPTEKMKNKINDKLLEYDIPFTYLSRPEFFKFYTLGASQDMKKNYEVCPTSGCWEVYRGNIMRCSAAIAYEKLNNQFNTKYIIDNTDKYDLYDEKIDGFYIKDKLNKASHLCKYCDIDNMERFEWFNGGVPELKDYVL